MSATATALCSLIFYLCVFHSTARLPINQLFGIKYISYTNFDGTLANGDCCDEPGKLAGSCTPDMCDTFFVPCATRDPMNWCDIIQPQRTPVTYNNNSLEFGSSIGNTPGLYSTSFLVVKFPFQNNDINFTIEACESSNNWTMQEIATFQILVDWVDPVYLNPPIFKRFVLNDTRAQLVVDIVSQCNKYYYTEDCSVYCKPDKVHYTCLDNGTIDCLPGWSGPKCLTMIDHCPGNKCQHKSACLPILLDYKCVCSHGFTGRYCQTVIPTSAITMTTPTNTGTHRTTSKIIPTSVMTVTPPTNVGTYKTTSKLTDGDDVDDDGADGVDVGLVAGVSVGVLMLLLVVTGMVVFYTAINKKKRSQVSNGIANE